MMVEQWFGDFALNLIDRSNRTDWPDGDSEFWIDFRRALVRVGATAAQADEAASVVCDLPNLFPNQYRPLIVEAVKVLQKRAVADAQAAPGSPEAARVASKDCPDCGGTGGAVRFVHADIADRVRTVAGNVVPVGGRVTYPCGCPLGQVLAVGLREPGSSRPPLTIADYPSLRLRDVPWSDRPDNRYRHHPDDWDSLHDRPMPPEAAIETVADLRHLVASLRGREGGAIASAEEPLMPDTILAPERVTEAPGRSPAETLDPALIVLPEDEPGWF